MSLNILIDLFPQTPIAELAYNNNERVLLCAYNNLCIPELGICRLNLCMPDEKLELLHVNSNKTESG